MIELPTSVKIGCFTYQIEEYPANRANADGKMGACSNLELTIRVDKAYGGQHTANSLLHEILHGVAYVANYEESGPDRSEEFIVAMMANGLMQVMRDNPQVFDWIREHASG